MNTRIKKTFDTILSFLRLIKEFYPSISGILTSISISSIFLLASFLDFFNNLVKIRIELPLPVIIASCPLLLYSVIMPVMRFIDAFKKPRYLKFTIMKYKDWKLRWDYKPTDNCERYDIVNIRPVCKKCGCKLIAMEKNLMYCPQCEIPEAFPYFNEADAVRLVACAS